MSPEHCLELERWQGLPNINQVKHYEIVLSFKVSLIFSLFSHENKESLLIHSEDLSLLIEILSPKQQNAPFKCWYSAEKPGYPHRLPNYDIDANEKTLQCMLHFQIYPPHNTLWTLHHLGLH